MHFHLGVPYFEWIARTEHEAKSFQPGFAQFPIPPDANARKRIMMRLAPSLISFALHYKAINDTESLMAFKVLMKDIPKEFFEQPIKEALPELFS